MSLEFSGLLCVRPGPEPPGGKWGKGVGVRKMAPPVPPIGASAIGGWRRSARTTQAPARRHEPRARP